MSTKNKLWKNTGAGLRLREERARLKLSTSEFAEKIGIHRNTQANYELERREFGQPYVEAIKVLGVDITYVLDGVKSEEAAEHEVRTQLSRAVFGALGYSDEDPWYMDSEVALLMRFSYMSTGVVGQSFEDKLRETASELVLESPVMRAAGGIDTALLTSVIEATEAAALASKQVISPAKKAQTIALLYRTFKAEGKLDQSFLDDTFKLFLSP